MSSQALSGVFGQPEPDDSNTFASAGQAFAPAYTPADSQALQSAESFGASQTILHQNAAAVSNQGVANPKPSGATTSLIRIIYVIAAVIFLALYTFVWIKIFNVQIPY
jgi:hypothetical protein